MASYLASNASRDTVTIMMSNSEARALLDLAEEALRDDLTDMKGQRRYAADRAIDALTCALSPSARRAGFFDQSN